MEINPRLFASEPMRRCSLNECQAACCLYGVWLDENEWTAILENANSIIPHMPEGWDDPQLWTDGRTDDDPFSRTGRVIHSRVLIDPQHYGKTACVFLRADHKCALQVASEAAGHAPWHWKPFYCILHPLDLDENGQITLDHTEPLLDEPGSCLRPSPQPIPLMETFEPELRYFLGSEQYEQLRNQHKK